MKFRWFATSVLFLFIHAKEIPDSELNITQVYEKYGYPAETHQVETEDGYLLGVYRVPHGRKSANTKNQTMRYPVLLMHGLLGSAENFMYLGPDKSLSYMLADRGYDVWLGNARGNTHSRKHITLNPDRDKQFWHFSWHEIGVYDLPAIIDYILNKTGHSDLFYYGHSQGTTSFFVMTSSRPNYNKKIRLMIALAPVVFMKHATFMFRNLAKYHVVLDRLARTLNINEFIPLVKNEKLRIMLKNLCGRNNVTKVMCKGIFLNLGGGNDPEQFDEKLLPFILNSFPAGASSYQLLHYAQNIETGKFRQYDFGAKKNRIKYNSKIPPDYNLKNVVAPVALFYSVFDDFSAVVDVNQLYKILSNVVEYYKVPWPKFTHSDYCIAKDSDVLFINKGLDLMEKYKDM